jgi:lipopolysaccharide biosynthesis glycosyltransferase
MAEKKIVPIVFCTTDAYVPPLSVAMQSIMENAGAGGSEYRFFVLQQGVSVKNQELLHAQVKRFGGFSLDVIDVTRYIEGITFYNLNFSIAAYFRFLAPYLLQEYERIIYLDCDIICLTDIALLLAYDYGAYVLGAAHRVISDDTDWAWVKEYAKNIGLSDYRNYFNSGVLVINTKKWRDMISQEAILEMAAATTYIFPDQDMLNVLCEDKVCWFPMQWNSMMDIDIPSISDEQFHEYHVSRTKPCIIHLNADKPWKKNSGTERTKRVWDYAGRTPFADDLRATLRENEARQAAPVDADKDECIFFSNNLRETELAESQLQNHGIETKRGAGAENCAFNVYVSKDAVEKALAVLTEASPGDTENEEGVVL